MGILERMCKLCLGSSFNKRHFAANMATQDFTGKTVLVAGSTGCIGSAITKHILQLGGKVIGTSTSEQKFEELRSSLSEKCAERLYGKILDCSVLSAVKNLCTEEIQEHGAVHQVVTCVGYWRQFVNHRCFTDHTDYDDFEAIVKSQGQCLFVLAKVFLPYLDQQPGSTFTYITGTFGSMDHVPSNGEDLVILFPASATQNGISAAVRTEYHKANVAVHDVRIGGFHVRDKVPGEGPPDHSTVYSEEMAQFFQYVLHYHKTHLIELNGRQMFLKKLKEYSRKYHEETE